MAVRDVAYVELYTNDKRTAADYFVSSMGFTRTAESVGVDRSSVMLQQGDVRLLITMGTATWKFLECHGEGIANIAMTCEDVGETFAAAVAAGARTVSVQQGIPTVSGFGGVSHTLLPLADDSANGLPPGHNWVEVPEETGRRAGPVRLLDHVAICLEGGTLQQYADFYHDAFGLARYSSEYVDVGEHAMDSIVVRSPSGGVTFTLVAPDLSKGPGQLNGFLERNGAPGVQHLAFLVDAILPAVHEFRERGVQFLSTPDAYYDKLQQRMSGLREEIAELRSAQVLADRDEWGYLLQLFSRSPHERNTLFYELIQRQGSRGFGSANIRALYDAVERERLAIE
ncbi:4-hydroxyphenylpyruvate dioxygenase [Streptomyces sp. NPDC058985]|uniref:4-hydroxyphenylpyruvate dioxygenase n=1 Tax=Streptomyces sp. NPDC058985 TaxID=3346684 RepID=UPI003684581C